MSKIEKKVPHLFVIAAPSGAGKTSLVKALVKVRSDIRFSVSHTTRQPRVSERRDIDYFFVKKHEFESMVKAGEFLEHAKVFGNYYGTGRRQVEDQLAHGNDVLLEIDWQGAQQVKNFSVFLKCGRYWTDQSPWVVGWIS